jgi:phage terminase small subunit
LENVAEEEVNIKVDSDASDREELDIELTEINDLFSDADDEKQRGKIKLISFDPESITMEMQKKTKIHCSGSSDSDLES